MNKLIDKINKKENLIMVICIVIIFACITFFFYTYSNEINKKDFIYKNSLDDIVLTISSEDKQPNEILLKDFSYYIIVAESNTQSQALFFREETPVNYWELKTAPLENVRSITKDFCIETCVKDYILYMEALKNEITLTKEEERYLQEVSYDIYENLTANQVDVTDIKLGDIANAQTKIFLAEKYTLSLIEEETIKDRTELSCDGEYYLNQIKSQYNIEENKQILDELVFGSITVNIEEE